MAKVDIIESPRRMNKAEKPQPTSPEPPKPEEKVPTPQELAERQDNLFKAMFKIEPPTPPVDPGTTPDPNPPAEPTAAEPKTPTQPAVVTPAATPPVEPVIATAPEPSPTMADIERTATIAANRVLESQRQTEPKPGTPAPTLAPAPDMSPEDRRDYEVVCFLASQDTDKYGTKPAQFLEYTKAYYAYQDEWTKRNEGQEFDADDPEHNAWFATHDPGVSESEIESGRERMMEERIFQNRVKPELDKIEREKAVNAALPGVIANINKNILSMVEAADPELAKHVTGPNGEPIFTPEARNALAKASPIAKRQFDEIVRNELEPMIFALEMTAVVKSDYKLNPQANPHHARIADYITQAEQDMLAAPSDVRVQNGREFATISQFQRMQQSIQSSNASAADKERQLNDLEARFWTLSIDEIEQVIVADIAEKAKKRIADEREIAKSEFGSPNGNGHLSSQPPEPATPRAAQPTAAKPRPPSVGSGGDTARTTDQGLPRRKSFGETMADVMYRK